MGKLPLTPRHKVPLGRLATQGMPAAQLCALEGLGPTWTLGPARPVMLLVDWQ